MSNLLRSRFACGLFAILLTFALSACANTNTKPNTSSNIISTHTPVSGLTIREEVTEDGTEVIGFSVSSAEGENYLIEHKDELIAELGFTAHDIDSFEQLLTNLQESRVEIARLEAEIQQSSDFDADALQQYCNPSLDAGVRASRLGVTASSSASGCVGQTSIVQGYAKNANAYDRYYDRANGRSVWGSAGVGAGGSCEGWAMAAVTGHGNYSDYARCRW